MLSVTCGFAASLENLDKVVTGGSISYWNLSFTAKGDNIRKSLYEILFLCNNKLSIDVSNFFIAHF